MPQMCALDQAGDIGNHEAAEIIELHDAKLRLERRKRIIGDLGRAAESREMSVDLPALGNPTRPTSASSFSSSRSRRSWPGRPGSCSVGAWCVDVAKRALPRPP